MQNFSSSPYTLIVVDMQNDFVTGPLGSNEARAIVPNVVDRIAAQYERHNTQVIYTRDTHYAHDATIYSDYFTDDTYKIASHIACKTRKYSNTSEGLSLPIDHCVVGTKGHGIIPEITALWDTYDITPIIVDKYSFGSLALPRMMEDQEYQYGGFEILGLVTDCCVLANAIILRNYFPRTRIQLNAKCCAGSTPQLHQAALDILKLHQIEII